MANTIVIGSQWGDEGKAKIVDYLTEKADVVIRFQGGANAGHTVIVEDRKFIFHLLPAGILYPDKTCVIGNGVVFEPEAFFTEIRSIEEGGTSVAGRLFLSDRAHVVMPYHKALDKAKEAYKGTSKIGTTGRGIGPAYADKVSRTGIRVADLLSPDTLKEKVFSNLDENNFLLEKRYGGKALDPQKILDDAIQLGENLKPYIIDTSRMVNDCIRGGKGLLFEGAQGTFLDVDHGTFPYVTSSNTVASAACAGAGIGPTKIDHVVGVVKAYTTRVGNGPFPTELNNEEGENLRAVGGEFGATTGRPRRCGWFDAVMLRKSMELNGLTSLAITKLDVLDALKEIKVAVRYKIDGQETDNFPVSIQDLEKIEPVYETVPGWESATTECKNYDELPRKAKDYLQYIREKLDTPISIVSVGPRRDQTLTADL